mgnify:CR=1 FL=1
MENTNNTINKLVVIVIFFVINIAAIAIIVDTEKINPPIVGVPDLALCAFTNLLVTCLAFLFLIKGTKKVPKITDTRNPIKIASTDFANINIKFTSLTFPVPIISYRMPLIFKNLYKFTFFNILIT